MATAEANHSPREYQLEMLRQAKEESVIIKLNTGSGKTFIAVLLIKDLLPQTERAVKDGGKRIIFLVKTVHLVAQQAAAIRRHTSLNEEDVGEFHGQTSSTIDYWEANRWEREFNTHKVLVFTAGIFKDILNHAKYSLRHICLLIFDECHHSAKDDDYAHICRHLAEIPPTSGDRPKVLGLTASVVNGNMKESQIAVAVAMLEMRLNARLITSSSSLANAFGDFAQERLAFYDQEESRWSNFRGNLPTELTVLQEMLREQRQLLKSRKTLADLPAILRITANVNLVEKAKRAVSDCLAVLLEVGPWGALCTARVIARDLEESAQHGIGATTIASSAIDTAQAALRAFVRRLEAAGVTAPGSGWVSNKVTRLLELLQSYFSADEHCRGIVFVEQRAVCFALCSLLQHPAVNDSGPWRAAFVTGHGTASAQASEARMAANAQLQIVREFRVGDKNLLVATKVVEEGMDIQACNLVIKFDAPNDYRSYVQSKGRARAKDSTYVVFIPRTLDNGLKERFRLQDFTRVTEQLNKTIENRAVDEGWYDAVNLDDLQTREDEILNNNSSVFQPFGPQGPRITLNSAMGIVNRYIGRLRHDCFVAPKAHVFVLKEDVDVVRPPRACVLLPLPCPLRQPIYGPPAVTGHRARKWAALEACRRLFDAGQLGDDLLPFPKEREMMELDEEEEEEDKEEAAVLGKVGSRRRRRLYSPEVTPELGRLQTELLRRWGLKDGDSVLNLAGRPLTLYLLEIQPAAFQACHLNTCLFESSDAADLRLGFFLPSAVDSGDRTLARFPLFFPNGPSDGALECGGQRFLSADHLNLLERFHCLLLSCLLGPNSTFAVDLHSAAPLDAFHFNFGAAQLPALCALVRSNDLALAVDKMETALRFADCRTFSALPRDLWPGSLLRARHYRGSEQHQRERWVVRRVADHLTPLSAFPDVSKAPTYAAYFNHVLSDLEQPLLDVLRVPTVPETALFRHPEAVTRTHRRTTEHNIQHLVPELCDRYPLSIDLWLLVAPLPAALYRLQQLLVAAQLHRTIWPLQPLPAGPAVLRWDASGPQPNGADLTSLVAALTAIECRDFLNLERLELMGDSFLKFAVSTTLFARSEGPNVQEGVLTSRRKRFISNSRLFKAAVDRGLSRCFRPRFFDLAMEFWPPGFAPKDNDLPPAWMRTISDKALADCVEAIIGYSVVHLGQAAALGTLRWFGIDPGFEVMSGDEVRFPRAPLPQLAEISEESRANALERLTSGLEKVEAIIGYQFRRKEFLVQALTHASCVDNFITECYQKLEYLGDAVIDFLITQRIFHDGIVRNPGQLSDLRSALVNNNTFAAIVVRAKLHKFLRHAEPRLFKLIPQFEAVQEERKHYLRHIQFMDDSDGNVTVKILGDLFESIAGAIFVDSNFSLDLVDRFLSNIMSDVIDDFSKSIPKNPVRMLHETFPGIKFSDVEKDDDTGLTRLSVTIEGETFSVVHRNKKTCKRALAYQILDKISSVTSKSST